MPHPFLAMDGVLQQGRNTITFIVEMLREAFGVELTGGLEKDRIDFLVENRLLDRLDNVVVTS